ncbi:tyrosine-protein phosphatase [Caminibacter mediatlanticus]|uniref:protein-tyrosine-phosphatase n=1 Tax=Caminibacter mediatlanticus TB-2 TaxID=391592 RepID=A0AAI9F1R4_9BACT|nr:CpsB/CapC family capsule biosynthesis tyrosine phosphatase [Caminibacter mediatlanticus]EDM22985.1 capsular polysaccharide biosythesis protein [Caminibacter mediatlanticus TB-2]
MIFFKKIKKIELKTDIHSHLLPGIDDGVKTIDESLSLIKEYINLGYKKLIITPHVMYDSYNNSTDLILEKINYLKNECFKNNLNIELEVSAEYNFDEEFVERIEKNDLLPINKKYILFEFSFYQKPVNYENIIFKLKSKGYIPILAHPERYRYFDLEDFKSLKELEVMFQCNIISSIGFYGKTPQKKFKELAKNKMIDFLGSDVHSFKYMEALKISFNSSSFNRLVSNLHIKNSYL